MSKVELDPANLGFKTAVDLGVDDPLLRGAVVLQRRDESAGAGRTIDGDAQYMASLLASGDSALIAAVDVERRWQPPVASLISTVTPGESRIRRSVELTGLAVHSEFSFSDRAVLTGVMVALGCQGRNRFRQIAANVNPDHGSTIEALLRLGFERDEALSGVEIFVGVPPQDHYTIPAGQLALRRVGNLDGGPEMLHQANTP